MVGIDEYKQYTWGTTDITTASDIYRRVILRDTNEIIIKSYPWADSEGNTYIKYKSNSYIPKWKTIKTSATITAGDYNFYHNLDYVTTATCDTLYWSQPVVNLTPEQQAQQRADRIRAIIRERVAPAMHVRRTGLTPAETVAESRARETLRRVLGDMKFRQFLKNGFVTVVGKSGKLYKIHPGHAFTEVYEKGQIVQRLCVVMSGEFPPTDSLIMRFLLLLNNEEMFWSKAIKHGTPCTVNAKVRDNRPLLQIMRELKVA